MQMRHFIPGKLSIIITFVELSQILALKRLINYFVCEEVNWLRIGLLGLLCLKSLF